MAKKSGRTIRILNVAQDVSTIDISSDFQGSIDTIEAGFLRGWAKPAQDDELLLLDLFVNGELVGGPVAASERRQDLADEGLGDVAFGIALPARFSGKQLEIELRLSNTNNIVLSRNFDSVAPWAELSDRYTHRIERLDCTSFRGWAVDKFDPTQPFSIDILINGAFFYTIDNATIRGDLVKNGISSDGTGGFSFDFPANTFGFEPASVSLEFPNGSRSEARVVSQAHAPHASNFYSIIPEHADIAIIVPIYNAYEDLQICLERLFAYTDQNVRLILIDDASPEPEIKSILAEYEGFPNVTVIYNSTNLGFTRSVNLGIDTAGRSDVVLLNSDARVTPRWLEGLRRAASSDRKICSVTPLSNRAGAFSAPASGNENVLPEGISEPEFAMAVRRRGRGLYPSVPTGNGFCMYIRRAALDEVGKLDVDAFPRGYGEENDFCMRAERAGWRHVIDDRTYVFHERSKSFKSEKTELIVAGRAVVDERYPEYKHRIQVFSKSLPINLARFNASLAVGDLDGPGEALPRILYVISTMTGGTPQTNRDLMLAVSSGWEPWLLHCDSKTVSLYKVGKDQDTLIQRHHLIERVDPVTFRSFEYDKLVEGWLHYYEFDVAHIRHMAWHSISLPALARNAGAAVVMSFHDYHVLCPTVKLKDENGNFCAGSCTSTDGQCQAVLWPENSFPPLKNAWIHEWRSKYARALEPCDVFVTTSQYAKDVISAHLPMKTDNFIVIPHGRDFNEFGSTFAVPQPGDKLKILVPGNIDEAKGSEVIKALLEMDAGERLEFHILGQASDTLSHPRITVHGAYKRDDFTSKARAIGAHVGAVFSTWDETWCHTLTEVWSAGLPAIVLDYPTMTSRVNESGAGWVLAKDDVAAIYPALLRILSDYDDYFEKLRNVQKWQRGLGKASTTRLMGAKYELAYKSALAARDARQGRTGNFQPLSASSFADLVADNIVAVVCPADAGQNMANASTHIRVWERTLNRPDEKYQYCRMTADQFAAAAASGQVSKAILQRNVLSDRHWAQVKPSIISGRLKAVIDLDDDLLDVPADKDSGEVYLKGRQCLEDVIRSVNAVFVSTPTLHKRMLALNPNVHLTENGLSTRIWRGRAPSLKPSALRTALYMGTTSHFDDLRMIIQSLLQVARENPYFRLKVVGVLTEAVEEAPWIEVVNVPDRARNYPEFVTWLKTQSESCDFGIAPLVDSEFNRSKSALKVLEYAGLGLPVLASRGTVYDKTCSEAPHATAVDNNESDWYQALTAMLEKSRDELRSEGEIMREWVMTTKSLDPSIAHFRNVLEAVFS